MQRSIGATLFLLPIVMLVVACAAERPASPTRSQQPEPTHSPAASGIAASTQPNSAPDEPIPLPAATATSAFVSPPQPQVLEFRVAPTITTHLGESIAIEWQAEGDSAELCWLDGRGPTTCEAVALAGDRTLTVDELALTKTGLGLRVTSGGEFTWGIADLALQCQDLRQWFFDDPPLRCPSADAQISPAAAQFFEHGMMIWTETPDTFYIFFDEPVRPRGQTFLRFSGPYDFGPEQPLAATPPDGLQVPVSGFGQIWRGELSGTVDENIRSRLGWAIAPEFAFESASQCETQSHPRGWACYLQVPDGRVLRLQPDSTAQVNLLWREYVAPK